MPPDNSQEKLLDILSKLIAELHPNFLMSGEITLDSDIDRDLGLDSLARIELLARVEKAFDAHLPEKAFATIETPRDILRALLQVQSSRYDGIEEHASLTIKESDRKEIRVSQAETLLDVLQQHVLVQPDTEHIMLLHADSNVSISYGDLHREALKVAARLRQLHLEQGEPVAIMLPTGINYFHAFFGILYGGGVPVPLYPPARPTQIQEHVRRHRKILSNAGTSLLITVEEVKPVARLLMSQVPGLKKIVTVGELYRSQPGQIPMLHRANDTAFLQYTSGSTGDPKGVILSHANLLANIKAMGKVCNVTTKDVFVSWLPLYHDMGLIGAWLGSLYHGCRLVVMPPLSFLARPERWLKAIDRFGGTLSASPNFGYEFCCTRINENDIEGLDLSTWRMAFNGAEPVIPRTLRRFIKRFEPYGLQARSLAPVYGLAESSVGLAFPRPGTGITIDSVHREKFVGSGKAEPPATKNDATLEFVSCGRPLPGHQIRIIDSQGRELPERHEGTLQFKGPSSTSGYYRNSSETRKLFSGEWLDSGDLAYIASGNVYITSRVKDIIIRGGRNIYAHELEELINNIEGIRRGCTAVFGSREQGDSIEKLVVLAESRKQKEEELTRIRKMIDSETIDLLGMAPDDVVIAPPGTVLKTSSGKIRRSACRKLYESGHLGQEKAAVWLQLARVGLESIAPLLRRFTQRLRALLYGGYCWLLLAIFAVFTWCGLMVLPGGRTAWKLAGISSRLLCKLAGIRVACDGLETFPAGNRYLLVSNHMSYLDSIILTGLLPEQSSFVAKAELARNPFLRAGFKKLGVLLVDRFDTEQSIEDTKKINNSVHQGMRPFFFVEGTLQRMPGLLPFHMGAFLLASEEQLPIVPVILQGTRNILRGGSWFPRHGAVHVTFASPCYPESEGWQGAIEIRDRVRGVMLHYLDEPDLAGEYTSLLQLQIKKPPKQ